MESKSNQLKEVTIHIAALVFRKKGCFPSKADTNGKMKLLGKQSKKKKIRMSSSITPLERVAHFQLRFFKAEDPLTNYTNITPH